MSLAAPVCRGCPHQRTCADQGMACEAFYRYADKLVQRRPAKKIPLQAWLNVVFRRNDCFTPNQFSGDCLVCSACQEHYKNRRVAIQMQEIMNREQSIG